MSKKDLLLESKLLYNQRVDKFSRFVLSHPLSVCYKINQKCNYSCSHCIASSSMNGYEGLPTSEAKKVIRNVSNSGVIRLDITGGEPYLRKDIDELLSYAIGLGLEVVITTNGSLLTSDNIKTLKFLGILVQISIDGYRELNDSLRGKGSFDTSLKAVKMLREADVPVRINFTIQKKNVYHMDDILEIASSVGVESVYFILACAQGRASTTRSSVCLTDTQEKKVRKKILNLRLTSKINVKILDFKKYSHACVLIEPNGDFISQSWDEKDCLNTGNLLKENVETLWIGSGAFDHALHLMQYIRHPMLYN